MSFDDKALAIMQPYFFPYIGYFSLIERADHFIFFDTPQYVRRSWMNRNRIRCQNSNEESAYITVPLNKPAYTAGINEVEIAPNPSWRRKIFGQLEVYRRVAPFYHSTVRFLQDIIKDDYKMLSELTIQTITDVCGYLGITTNLDIFSRMALSIDPVNDADEWSLNITKALGYQTYVNAIGGQAFFNIQKFIDARIKIEFLKHRLPDYDQKSDSFIPGLSIIDVMMFNSRDEIRDMLNDYELLKADGGNAD